MRPRLSAVLLAALLPFASAAPSPSLNSQLSTFNSSSISSPAPADSQCSSLTRAPDGTLHLTYYGPAPAESAPNARTLWHATLAPAANAFSAPRAIVTTPLLMENWADFATLVVGTDGALTAQWFQTDDSGGRHSYSGWFARSTDAGTTWSTPAPLGHEFVALAPLGGGRTLAVWLESTRAHGAHSASAQKSPPAPYAPSMKLMARLLSPVGTALGDWTVDADVCTCCQNTVAVLPGDRVFVAYRGHNAEEIRDHKFAIFDLATASWSPPATLRDDHWKIPACPVNGPAADARDASLTVAWFTAANNTPSVFARTSADAGRTFTAPVQIDLGRPMGRLETVMLSDHSAVLLWLEMKSTANAAGLYARRLFADGSLSAPQLLAETTQARASGFPRAALRPDGRVLVSYTQNGELNQVRTFTFDPRPLARSTLSFRSSTAPLRGGTGTAGPGVLELCESPLASLH
jgi:hypothetical protein